MSEISKPRAQAVRRKARRTGFRRAQLPVAEHMAPMTGLGDRDAHYRLKLLGDTYRIGCRAARAPAFTRSERSDAPSTRVARHGAARSGGKNALRPRAGWCVGSVEACRSAHLGGAAMVPGWPRSSPWVGWRPLDGRARSAQETLHISGYATTMTTPWVEGEHSDGLALGESDQRERQQQPR